MLKEWAHYYNVQNDDQNDDVECNVHSIFHSRYKLERYTWHAKVKPEYTFIYICTYSLIRNPLNCSSTDWFFQMSSHNNTHTYPLPPSKKKRINKTYHTVEEDVNFIFRIVKVGNVFKERLYERCGLWNVHCNQYVGPFFRLKKQYW